MLPRPQAAGEITAALERKHSYEIPEHELGFGERMKKCAGRVHITMQAGPRSLVQVRSQRLQC